MSKPIHIDIILPCYNPPVGWEEKVICNFNQLQQSYPTIHFHLYIASDGSRRGYDSEITDRIKAIIPTVRLMHYEQNQGKGYALRHSIRHCQSEYMIYTDYDFPYTSQSFDNVVQALLEGADVVVAIRDKNYQRNLPAFRKFLSRSSHWVNRLVLRLKIKDTQGGLKGFNRKGREIFLSTTINSFLFDTEFIYKATYTKGITIKAVNSRIKNGLEISDMGFRVMKRELLNFFTILRNK